MWFCWYPFGFISVHNSGFVLGKGVFSIRQTVLNCLKNRPFLLARCIKLQSLAIQGVSFEIKHSQNTMSLFIATRIR